MYAPSGIAGGSGSAFIYAWRAECYNGVTGRDCSAPAFPRVGPVKSLTGGAHCSFGQIFGGGNAFLYLEGGNRGVDPANCVIAGVIDAAHGSDPAPQPMVVFELGASALGLRISADRFLEVYGALGVFPTGIRPTAGPMAFALWSTGGEVRLACSGYPIVASHAPVAAAHAPTTSDARTLTIAAAYWGGLGFKGGVRCLAFWDKQRDGFGSWTTEDLVLLTSDLGAGYGVVPPTELLIIAGDSYGAGFKMFGGDSIAQWLAINQPQRRVLNLARAGAVASDPSRAISDVLHDQLPTILDTRNLSGLQPVAKTILVFDGHNEVVAQNPTPAAYIDAKLQYTAALTAAGFRVVWADINPISVRGSSDVAVDLYEQRRRALRAAIAGADSPAVHATYCDIIPALSTGAGTVSEVRHCTQGELYYTPEELRLAGTETWAVGTWSDELHMGVAGWTAVYPYLAAALNGTEPLGRCCTGPVCTMTSAGACAQPALFGGLGGSCQPNLCSGACCDVATGSCAFTPRGECAFAGWNAGGTCATSPCGPGACCMNGACQMLSVQVCASIGAFQGIGSLCAPPSGSSPCCLANFDHVAGVTLQDIFAFLNGWLAGVPEADIDDDGQLSVADIFAFLNLWFAGC